MGLNKNNYLGTELQWTKYTNDKELPKGVLIFRSKGEKARPLVGNEFEYKQGHIIGVNQGKSTSLILDGHFSYDYDFWLKDAEWTLINFILYTGDDDD